MLAILQRETRDKEKERMRKKERLGEEEEETTKEKGFEVTGAIAREDSQREQRRA